MIKRTYFMVFRKHEESGRYAENSFTVSIRSWSPDIGKVFKESLEIAKDQLRDHPGETVFCTTFNRL